MEEIRIWESTKKIISNELNLTGYNTWIKTLKLIRIENQTIILEAQTEFYKDIITSRYLSVIENALKSVTFEVTNTKIINAEKEVEKLTNYDEIADENLKDYFKLNRENKQIIIQLIDFLLSKQ